MASITISVNIAEGNKWEGNAEYRLDIPEKDLIYLDRNQLATELDYLLTEALVDYRENNYGS